MLNKTQVNHIMENMPEQFSVDQLLDKLVFVDKIENGISQSKNGQVNSKEQVKKKLGKWLK